jgi:hypothetical protein
MTIGECLKAVLLQSGLSTYYSNGTKIKTMHYQFQYWDALLANELHPNSITTTCSKTKFIEQCNVQISEEARRIMQDFRKHMLLQASVQQ